MVVKYPSLAFAIVGFAMGAVAALSLYVFFGPQGRNLGVAGISGPMHLAAFPIVSMLVSAGIARGRFGDLSLRGTRADGFLRGATIALLAFAACIAVHAILVLVRMDAGAAVWLTLAAALFGGFAFGIPAMLVGGVTGALCMQGWRRDG